MYKNKMSYNDLADLLYNYGDKVQIYKDNPDGKYFNNISTKNEGDFELIDQLKSDGDISWDGKVGHVNDSSFVVIETIENGEQLKNPQVRNVSIILNDVGFGFLQSVILRDKRFDVFPTIFEGQKRTLECFKLTISENNFISIIPVTDLNKGLLNLDLEEKLEKPAPQHVRR